MAWYNNAPIIGDIVGTVEKAVGKKKKPVSKASDTAGKAVDKATGKAASSFNPTGGEAKLIKARERRRQSEKFAKQQRAKMDKIKEEKSKPIIDKENFAYSPEDMQKIKGLREQALGGFSGGEIAKRREGFQQPIESNRLAALRSLQRGQVHSGVKGGIAYAQSQDVNRLSAQASAGGARDLFLANENYKRQALGDLQGFLGKERYGQFASELGGRQLGAQQQGAEQQNQYQQAMLDYLKSQNPAALRDEAARMNGPLYS